MLQCRLGEALFRQANQSKDLERTRLLEESVQACRAALTVFIRQAQPKDWTKTQTQLGDALTELGTPTRSAEGARLLGEAVKAYRAALEVYTKSLSGNFA